MTRTNAPMNNRVILFREPIRLFANFLPLSLSFRNSTQNSNLVTLGFSLLRFFAVGRCRNMRPINSYSFDSVHIFSHFSCATICLVRGFSLSATMFRDVRFVIEGKRKFLSSKNGGDCQAFGIFFARERERHTSSIRRRDSRPLISRRRSSRRR